MTSNDEEIRRDAWQKTLEALTVEHEGDLVTIEVAELDLGDQLEAEQMPFSYIEYDPHDDAFSVGVGGRDGRYPVMLRHVVEHPQNIAVHASEVGSVTIEVGSPDGAVTLITIRARLELPSWNPLTNKLCFGPRSRSSRPGPVVDASGARIDADR